MKQTILNLDIVNDNSKSSYDAKNEITYNTEISKSHLLITAMFTF